MDNYNLQYVFYVVEYFEDGSDCPIDYEYNLPHHKEIKKFLEDSFKKFFQRDYFCYGVEYGYDFFVPGGSLELKVIQDEVTGEEKGVITWHLNRYEDEDIFKEYMSYLLYKSEFEDTFAYQVSDRKIPGVDKHYYIELC